ncbi:hypothetical protein Skr01_23170 [Sphaerisporangium krabiense]|uniref:Neutral metalloproteinase n=1 Tax=Sphaerisporangium krabiense TaxID=763782 RepID=A0A7W8Z6B4_9ACTN|nr:M4 family metallopeptidase [Sphaerisporangium krabiense]MBB5628065.1 hypothetical protein [Sphaerisporangium krabiense]GII62232.1 hypothetical protein Skr01_23170 [Sphaerisporangium krabiense]
MTPPTKTKVLPALAVSTAVIAATLTAPATAATAAAGARPAAPATQAATVPPANGHGYYNGHVTIDTSHYGDLYTMKDPLRPGLACGGPDGRPFTKSTDDWGDGTLTSLETACVDVLYAAQKEWDMLRYWLGRNGINGQGLGYPARVGVVDGYPRWSGSYLAVGPRQPGYPHYGTLDMVAHEYGHAIFETTPGGTGSGNETGGLAESAGDIFGALTEAFAANPNDPPDYTVGEKLDLTGNGRPLRYMYNPSLNGDPNCFSAAIPGSEVHQAAGPQNHWFYLLAEGTNPGGGKPDSPVCAGPRTLQGIGLQKAGKIFMGALLRKTTGWKYANSRAASVAAAIALYGRGLECEAVKAAWTAVNVPAGANEPLCGIVIDRPDFSLSLTPSSGSLLPGQVVASTVDTRTDTGVPQTVTLTAWGLPAGTTASFSPSAVTSGGRSTLTISSSATTPPGTRTVTVTGSGDAPGNPTHSTTYTLTIRALPTPTP